MECDMEGMEERSLRNREYSDNFHLNLRNLLIVEKVNIGIDKFRNLFVNSRKI